ncbi:hypothetical protein ACFWQG_13230 [Rhodococcus sp. NPDC058532]|uniref:hypothetical protein n=1 Tax=Rhodococcus sp. NPDC058532 TaxID=3346540 RepID=UPI0036520C5C
MTATDFRLHREPREVAPKVHVGMGTVADDSTRIYLHANNAELTRPQVLRLIGELATLAGKGTDQ